MKQYPEIIESGLKSIVCKILFCCPVSLVCTLSTGDCLLTDSLFVHTHQAPKPSVIPVVTNSQSSHRVILPATSTQVVSQANVVTTLAPIQPAPAVTSIAPVGQLPPGTAILSAGNSNIQGLQGFALVPASYVTQVTTLYTILNNTGNHTIHNYTIFFTCWKS